MKQQGFIHYLVFAFLLCTNPIKAEPGFDDARIAHAEFPEWFVQDPFYDLATLVNEVQQKQLAGLMVLYTTEGCSYCELFIRKSLGNAEIANKVKQDFLAIGMEIFDDRELSDPSGEDLTIKAFALREGVQFAPTLLFYGGDGQLLLRATGYQAPERFVHLLDYVTQGHWQNTDLKSYFRDLERSAKPVSPYPELKEDPLFIQPPYMLDRSRIEAQQPLLVIYEGINCTECARFHNEVLADVEIRSALLGFDVARLDVMDDKTPLMTPDGRKTTPALWFTEKNFSRLPALMFFNEKGELSLETDALVLSSRMMNSINYMLNKAYLKGWTYQQFSRSQALEKARKRREKAASGEN